LHRLRPYTRLNDRATLDRVLLPRFGAMKIASITPEHVASLIRDLEQSGLSGPGGAGHSPGHVTPRLTESVSPLRCDR